MGKGVSGRLRDFIVHERQNRRARFFARLAMAAVRKEIGKFFFVPQLVQEFDSHEFTAH